MDKEIKVLQFDDYKNIIEKIIDENVAKNSISLAPSSMNSLVVHLTIAVLRIQSNNYISFSALHPQNKDSHYFVAQNICQKVESTFNITMPTSEVDVVTMHLNNRQLLDLDLFNDLDLLDDEVTAITSNALKVIKNEYQIDLTNNIDLISALTLHLQAALVRLEHDTQVENPLLDEIKIKHPQALILAQVFNPIINNKYYKHLDDGEIGFIALHLQVAL